MLHRDTRLWLHTCATGEKRRSAAVGERQAQVGERQPLASHSSGHSTARVAREVQACRPAPHNHTGRRVARRSNAKQFRFSGVGTEQLASKGDPKKAAQNDCLCWWPQPRHSKAEQHAPPFCCAETHLRCRMSPALSDRINSHPKYKGINWKENEFRGAWYAVHANALVYLFPLNAPQGAATTSQAASTTPSLRFPRL